MAVTMKTIAEAVGSSVATVSLALSDHPRVNEETKARIRETSLRLGYCTSADLILKKRQSARKLLRYHFVDLTAQNKVGNSFIEHLPSACRDKGFRLELMSIAAERVDERAEQILSVCHESSGMILYGQVDAPLLIRLAACDVPFVVVGPLIGPWPDRRQPLRAVGVGHDEIAVAREATEALLALGHRRIGLITARGLPGLYYDRWEDGYRLALSRAGLAYDAALHDASGDSRLLRGELPTCLQIADPPTAFLCPDPTYVNLMRNLTGDEVLSMTNTIVCGTERALSGTGLTNWPSYVPDVELLIQTCIATLEDLQYRPASAFHVITLSMHRRNLTQLTERTDSCSDTLQTVLR